MTNQLKWSSSLFAILGGVLIASNTEVTRYGFLFLALSSSQLLIASLLNKEQSMIVYSASVFIFVDSLGIYRWLLN
jgi:hypothetical protein